MIIKRLIVVVLILLGTAGLGYRVAQAANLCVHPAGAGRCFTSIQAAVDAAENGDRIRIRSGSFSEQITILEKDLILEGQAGTVIQAPAGMQDTLSAFVGVEGRPIILAVGADVTIRNVTIDGVNSAEANPFLQGIAFINAGGTIRDNVIQNIGFGEPHLPIINGAPSYQGEGILVANLSLTPRTITIEDNRVSNYNSNGINVFATADFTDPTIANLTAHVVDNTVIGSGPNGVIDQWGIFFSGFGFAEPQFSITGTIRGNIIRDQNSIAPHPLPGTGIVSFNTYNVAVSDNLIENVNVGLVAHQVFSAQVANNRITGPQADAAGSIGLLLSGRDIQVAQNRFKKLELGILLHVEHPDFGSALNTALIQNRFENVGADVLTGPGALLNVLTASESQAPWSASWPR